MGTSRGAAYRRFYLYSALSVAVIAISVAIAILIHLGFQTLGFGPRPAPGDASRNLSLSIALLAIAVPVGAAHLWLILRSFADPAERAIGIRHQFLNLWVAFALLVILLMVQVASSANAFQDGADITTQVSVSVVAAMVGAIAAWWISRSPPDSPQPRIRSAIVVMLITMAVAAFAVASAAAAGGALLQPHPGISISFGGPPFNSQLYQQRQIQASLITSGFALSIWALGFVWQRRWPESRDRLGYALAGYGLGTLLLLAGAAFGIAGAIRFARDPAEAGAFTTAWPAMAAGALLIAVHLTLLLRDRGRNGHPAVTTTRLLLAFPALVGLGSLVGGLGLAWHAVVERDIVPAQHFTDDVTQAAALLAIGTIAYVQSWLGLNERSTAESAVRRFYLFTVVCLALVAGLVSSVVVLYNAITAVAGVGDAETQRTALTWLVPAVALALIFAAHLVLLLRDQRRTRSAETPAATDPLVVLLEEVRAGRVTVESAASTIRGPLA